jgi:hypothetical protein
VREHLVVRERPEGRDARGDAAFARERLEARTVGSSPTTSSVASRLA